MEPVGPWRKSSHSSNPSGCVEVAIGPDTVTVRDSKHPGGPWLQVDRRGFAALIAAVQAGEFHPPSHERVIMAIGQLSVGISDKPILDEGPTGAAHYVRGVQLAVTDAARDLERLAERLRCGAALLTGDDLARITGEILRDYVSDVGIIQSRLTRVHEAIVPDEPSAHQEEGA